MKRMIAMTVLALSLAACQDQISTLSAVEKPLHSGSGSGAEVAVQGSTFGPKGEMWEIIGGAERCGTSWVMITWQGKGTYVGTDSYCQASAMSTFDAVTYDGGVIHIAVLQDGGTYKHLGTVPADLSKFDESFDIPVGGTVKLTPMANFNCQFGRWQGVPAGKEFANPLILPVSGSHYFIEGLFTCSGQVQDFL